MKKTIFLILFIAISCQLVRAQINITLGPIGGIGLSRIGGKDVDKETLKFLPSYDFGASIIFSPQAKWGIGADILYSAEGVRGKLDEENLDFHTNYIRVPLRFIYFFGDQERTIRPKVFLGSTFGFLIRAKFEDIDIKTGYKRFDMAAHAGAGVNILIANQIWLNTDLAYTYGLSNIYADDDPDEPRTSNRRVSFHIGILFGIRRPN